MTIVSKLGYMPLNTLSIQRVLYTINDVTPPRRNHNAPTICPEILHDDDEANDDRYSVIRPPATIVGRSYVLPMCFLYFAIQTLI